MKNLITSFAVTIFFSGFVVAAIPHLEQKDFSSLIKAASNTSLSMTERWQSLVKAGAMAQPDQIPLVIGFTKRSEWFMRNAALVSLEAVSSDYATEQAKVLIKDKALVVRSAAVTILSKKNTLEIKQLFATELAKPYNFSGSQSLWIRPQIMKQIVKLVNEDDRQFMARYLFDADKKVAALSAQALEKISGMQFDSKNQIQQWQFYVKKNGWL